MNSFGAELDGITILGGHSKPRTHFNKIGPNVGLAIIQKLVAEVTNDSAITVITSAKVIDIKRSENNKFSIKCATTPESIK